MHVSGLFLLGVRHEGALIGTEEILGGFYHAYRNVTVTEAEASRHISEIAVNDLHTQLQKILHAKGGRGRAIVHKAIGGTNAAEAVRIAKLGEFGKHILPEAEVNDLVTLGIGIAEFPRSVGVEEEAEARDARGILLGNVGAAVDLLDDRRGRLTAGGDE